MGAEGRDAAVEAVTRPVLAFLRRYPPFGGMEDDALRFLASRVSLGYTRKGSAILAPADGEPGHFYIIQAGSVSLAPAATYHPEPGGRLGPGECFSVGALLERRPVGSRYEAATDTFCYQLPAADFRALFDRSPRFRAFCTAYLGSLLRESRRLLRMHDASLAAEQQTMGRSLRAIVARPAVTCPPEATIGAALRAMKEEAIGSIVIAAPGGKPEGIFTRHDVLERVALSGRGLDEPIRSVMTPAPRTMEAEATAYDAALLIARHGIRHVPVMDGGRLIGVVTERDLFALQRVGIRSVHREIADAAETGDLVQAAADIRGLARNLVAEGVAAEPLTLIVSTLNDALTRRVIGLEQSRHALEGIAWGWLGFGSEGRYEQTISTDQDNGLVFAAAAGESAGAMRERLLPFAQAVNNTLAACGYPLCRGNIMARNPQWCLSLEEWLRRFEGWIANTGADALLGAAIFFDLRLIHGRDELIEAMRARILARCVATPRFLRQLAEQAVQARPPLGVLADFTVAPAEEGGGLDLKKQGARLFVDAARVVALSQGIAHTSTAERLRQGCARLGMGELEIAALVEAFFFIQMLRLRRQSAGVAASPNRIDPDALNEVDRRTLKESLRQAGKLQSRLALDYRL